MVKEPKDLPAVLKSALRQYPDGVLVEEYIAGLDIAVGFIEGVGHDDGLLTPVEVHLRDRVVASARSTSTTTG